MSAPTRFRLVPDPASLMVAGLGSEAKGVTVGTGPAEELELTVSAGVSLLSARPGALPVLEPVDHLPTESRGYVVEPVAGALPARMLFLTAGGARRPRVNGHPAPELTLLAPGDEVQLEHGVVLHVTLYHENPVGPVESDRLGQECPLCRVAFEDGDLAYVCPTCGTAVHFLSRPEGDEEPLECVRLLSACPVCEGGVVLEAGYSHQKWS